MLCELELNKDVKNMSLPLSAKKLPSPEIQKEMLEDIPTLVGFHLPDVA